MGLCQSVDLCFFASFRPCLHTFWMQFLHLFFKFSCTVGHLSEHDGTRENLDNWSLTESNRIMLSHVRKTVSGLVAERVAVLALSWWCAAVTVCDTSPNCMGLKVNYQTLYIASARMRTTVIARFPFYAVSLRYPVADFDSCSHLCCKAYLGRRSYSVSQDG